MLFRSILVAFALTFAIPSRAADLQCSHLPQLFEFYLRHHYAQKTMSDSIKSRTVEQYIKSLDPSKTMLLEADVEKLRGDLTKMWDVLQKGKCEALTESNTLLAARAKENETYVSQLVNNKAYKPDETLEFVFEPKKRGYPKTAEERQDTVTKMVHFQMLNYLNTEMKLAEAKKSITHRYELITKRIRERKAEDILASYAEAFALALDPHSSFLSRDNLEDFNIHMQLSLEGIGASLTSQDGLTVIEELIPGGGAERSKLLKAKDKILAVAQDGQKPVSIIDMDLREVVKLIRGKKGTKVTLTILRQGATTETLQVTIVRDKIDIKEAAAKMTYEKIKHGDKTYKIGILDLPSFYGGGKGGRSCANDVRALLEEAKREKVDGVVLNLTRNGGGLLDEAVKISGLFVKRGGIVATKDSDTKVQVLSDENDVVAYSGPLVVLTSRLSASASEILAGSLRDYKRAIIVGADHTFGKGTVQVISTLPLELGAMKVTTGMFFLPGGRSTQMVGVDSDIQLPSGLNIDDIGEVALDYALPSQNVPAFVSPDANPTDPAGRWEPVNEAVIKKLASKSAERIAKEPKFVEIRKNIEESKKNAGLIKLAEIRKKNNEKKKKKNGGKKDEDSKEAIREQDQPYVKEAANILVDWLTTKG